MGVRVRGRDRCCGQRADWIRSDRQWQRQRRAAPIEANAACMRSALQFVSRRIDPPAATDDSTQQRMLDHAHMRTHLICCICMHGPGTAARSRMPAMITKQLEEAEALAATNACTWTSRIHACAAAAEYVAHASARRHQLQGFNRIRSARACRNDHQSDVHNCEATSTQRAFFLSNHVAFV